MDPKTFLLVLVCACAASAAVKNDTVGARGFAYTSHLNTDEVLPLDYLYPDDEVVRMNKPELMRNKTKMLIKNISNEAVLFLTGPISTILMPSFYTLVCLISVPINICAVLAFASRIRPKKPAAIYMLNLACADLLFTLLLPFKISYHFAGNNWIFGSIMCRVVTAAFYWNMYCSVLLITCIGVDRLLAVVYPIDSLVWRRPRNAVISCVTMWILSFIGSVPLVLSHQTVYLEQLDITTCHDVQPLDELKWQYKIYFITICCALFFLPLIITVVSYGCVIWALSRVPFGMPGCSRRKRRVVVTSLTVLVIFVLCFMPTNTVLLIHYLQFNEGIQNSQEAPNGSYALYLVFLCLGSLNCCLDPMVYYFGSSQCQKQLSSALKCEKSLGVSISRSSRDSYRTSSCRTENTKLNPTKTDSNLNSQYKKLLV